MWGKDVLPQASCGLMEMMTLGKLGAVGPENREEDQRIRQRGSM